MVPIPTPSTTSSVDRDEELSILLELVQGRILEHVAEGDAANASRQLGRRSDVLPNIQAAALLSPMAVSKSLDLKLAEKPQGCSGLIEVVDRILKLSVNTWDQGFMHKLYSGTNPVGVISELILAVLNTNLHVYTVSPALSTIEIQTGRTLANMFGLQGEHSGGITQPGGSASNFNSVLIARHRASPAIKERGVLGHQLVLFTSVDSHYSIDKAAQMSGIGSQGVRKIPTDASGRMSVPALRKAVLDSRRRGEHPFYVNATAGTTVRGAYDPIDQIADICKEFGLWLHIDGSLGGPAIFSRRQSYRLQGSDRADSITINPHKMLSVPVTCSFLLGRDLRQFRSANSIDAGYLFHVDSNENIPLTTPSTDAGDSHIYDLAEFTPQCGRKGDALKLALVWVYYGRIGYEQYVDNAFDTAAYLAHLVGQHPRMEIAAVPQSVQVCFYYMPSSMGDGYEVAAKRNTMTTAYISKTLPNEGFLVDYAPGPVGNGATSHQVRDHFQSWVLKNLENRLRPDATNPQDDIDWVYATSTPRYEYCLFVDDLCLESMDYPGVNSPVVKLLCKNWESPFPPQQRNYTVPAPFHDGATEYDEEDVGWMYMPLQEYLDKYVLLGKGDWDEQYVRPPYIDGSEEESQFVEHWRQESLSKEA